ncbi:GTA-gp10 family protein [Allopontixanthobacter sediminis]|uniref:Tail tube GTA-gp10-like protein n=1 Tax=Allopontixanthobacter sediminis TaxID=1689985 RepID=A0A845B5S3_9SPHN|nr:GTA-gp10 family protein [Allopontixanthobacter sediminis]MXP42989.1 hypothetical protein [Allopontixanthobacter sediminis]
METSVTLPFGDGEYKLWLPLPQVFELERSCDTPMLAIEEKLRAAIGAKEDGSFEFVGGGAGLVREIRETIRLGLIGGNCGLVDGEEVEVGPLRAKQLTDLYAYPARPLSEGVVLAWRLLSAAIFGVELKKKAPPVKPARRRSSAKAK